MATAPPETAGPAPGAQGRDALYQEVADRYGAALDRLTRVYEADQDRRRDLLQEIHVALWRSLEAFDGRCSLRTWVYRVAQNVGASHVAQDRRARGQGFVGLEALETVAAAADAEATVVRRDALAHLLALVHRLHPVDRQVILLYLEGLDAAAIGEVTGLSGGHVATKIHRIKNALARQHQEGDRP
jgi:RNA polymerase sigma-70 factor, ECF subfamily